MTVVAPQRALYLRFQIESGNAGEPFLLVAQQHLHQPGIGIDEPTDAVFLSRIHKALHLPVRCGDISSLVQIETQSAHAPEGDLGLRRRIDERKDVVDELQRVLIMIGVEQHHGELGFPPERFEGVLTKARLAPGGFQDADGRVEIAEVDGRGARVEREKFALEAAVPQEDGLSGDIEGLHDLSELPVPELEHAEEIFGIALQVVARHLVQDVLAFLVHEMHALLVAFRSHVLEGKLEEVEEVDDLTVFLLRVQQGLAHKGQGVVVELGKIHGDVADIYGHAEKCALVVSVSVQVVPFEGPYQKGIQRDGPAQGRVEHAVDDLEQGGAAVQRPSIVKTLQRAGDVSAAFLPVRLLAGG